MFPVGVGGLQGSVGGLPVIETRVPGLLEDFVVPRRTSDHRVALPVIEVLKWTAWRTGDHRAWRGVAGWDGFWLLSSVGTGNSMVVLGPGRAVYSRTFDFCSFPVIEGGLYR